MSIAWLNKIKNYDNIKIVNKNVKMKKNVRSGISNKKTRTSIQMQSLKSKGNRWHYCLYVIWSQNHSSVECTQGCLHDK